MLCPITILYSAEYVDQSPRIKKLLCKRSMFMDSWWPDIQIMIFTRYGYSQKIVFVSELDKRHKFWFSVPLVINYCFIFRWNLLCSWYEFHCQTWHLMQRCVEFVCICHSYWHRGICKTSVKCVSHLDLKDEVGPILCYMFRFVKAFYCSSIKRDDRATIFHS